mgnify:CR=1 FL=1
MSIDLDRASEFYQAFELKRESLPVTDDKTAKAAKVVINILEFWELKDSRVYDLFTKELSKYEQNSEYKFFDEFVFVTSLLLGVYADLRKLFLQDVHHLEWMNGRNKRLDGETPKSLIASGKVKNIEALRALLRSSF